MGKTYRAITDDNQNGRDKKHRGKSTHGKRMKPYALKRGKFGVDKMSGNHDSIGFYGNNISETSKLITKNANRSLKKALRQKLKEELKKELENN